MNLSPVEATFEGNQKKSSPTNLLSNRKKMAARVGQTNVDRITKNRETKTVT
jgi:hypothetical protein